MIEVDEKTDVVVWLRVGLEDVRILAGENIMYAVLDELVPTADVHGKEKTRLAVWGGEMKTNAIKIDELDVE